MSSEEDFIMDLKEAKTEAEKHLIMLDKCREFWASAFGIKTIRKSQEIKQIDIGEYH